MPSSPLALGLAGAIPFVALTLALLFLPPPLQLYADLGLRGYGAVILSFLGGVHWGAAIHDRPDIGAVDPLRLVISVVPSLVGWAALLLPALYGYPLLALSFAALYAVDRLAVRDGLFPPWYAPLRLLLTGIVVACLSAAATYLLLLFR